MQTTSELQQQLLSQSDGSHSLTSQECSDFSAKFGLGLDEQPLAGWQSGRRCTLVDRERPLIGSKCGTLYLTHRYVLQRVLHMYAYSALNGLGTQIHRASHLSTQLIVNCHDELSSRRTIVHPSVQPDKDMFSIAVRCIWDT